MANLDLAFQLTANASGMDAGVRQASRQLANVGQQSKRTSAEFREAAKITRELRTPMEVYTDSLGRLDGMLAKGLLTQEVYTRAVAKADAELAAATDKTEQMAAAASRAERIINGLSGAIAGVGNATQSVADAGISVIAFGKDIAWTYLQWKVFSALRSPAGLKEFGLSALKGAMAARTVVLAAKAMGVGLALGGGAAGTAAAAVLGLSNPLIGAALLAFNLGKSFLAAKDGAYAMAGDIGKLNGDLSTMQATLGEIRVTQLDNLAYAIEESAAAGQRSEQAFDNLGQAFVTPFVGAFAAIESGWAGLTDGISGVVEGITSIVAPIGQALAPAFTLIGTVAEGAMKLAGVLGETLGLVLKVAGAAINTFLSPFIVGLTNLVDTIRSGMNSAFGFIGERIDWAQKKLDGFYKFMSNVPIIGAAFAGGGPNASVDAGAKQAGEAVGAAPAADVAAGADQAAKAAAEAAKEEEQAVESVNSAIARQEELLSAAIDKSAEFGQAGMDAAVAYQNKLRDLESQLQAGILNETSFANEAKKAKDAFDAETKAIEDRNKAAEEQAQEDRRQQEAQQQAQTAATDKYFEATAEAEKFGDQGKKASEEYSAGLMDLNRQLEAGMINTETYKREADKLNKAFDGQVDAMEARKKAEEKRAEEIKRAKEDVAKAGEFQQENVAALGRKSSQSLQGNDIRSSEGMAQYLALATGREDPALEENRKQTAKLNEAVAALKALQQAPIEILGAAA
jgi:hypothetical protein